MTGRQFTTKGTCCIVHLVDLFYNTFRNILGERKCSPWHSLLLIIVSERAHFECPRHANNQQERVNDWIHGYNTCIFHCSIKWKGHWGSCVARTAILMGAMPSCITFVIPHACHPVMESSTNTIGRDCTIHSQMSCSSNNCILLYRILVCKLERLSHRCPAATFARTHGRSLTRVHVVLNVIGVLWSHSSAPCVQSIRLEQFLGVAFDCFALLLSFGSVVLLHLFSVWSILPWHHHSIRTRKGRGSKRKSKNSHQHNKMKGIRQCVHPLQWISGKGPPFLPCLRPIREQQQLLLDAIPKSIYHPTAAAVMMMIPILNNNKAIKGWRRQILPSKSTQPMLILMFQPGMFSFFVCSPMQFIVVLATKLLAAVTTWCNCTWASTILLRRRISFFNTRR